MKDFDWHTFLQQWSRDLYQRLDEDAIRGLPPEVVATMWFGYDGASSTEIARLEERLSEALPSSYKGFLAMTNGWRKLDFFIDRVLPTDEVDWFATSHQEVVDAWAEQSFSVADEAYFVYGDQQDPALLRAEYLQAALTIGDGADNVFLLLNPRVQSADGEWEAWFFASWLPGAERFRTFRELMQVLHQRFVNDSAIKRALPQETT